MPTAIVAARKRFGCSAAQRRFWLWNRLRGEGLMRGCGPDIPDESLVVGQEWQGDVRIVLFVRLRNGLSLTDDLTAAIKRQPENAQSHECRV